MFITVSINPILNLRKYETHVIMYFIHSLLFLPVSQQSKWCAGRIILRPNVGQCNWNFSTLPRMSIILIAI
jgi:hypothetical protein